MASQTFAAENPADETSDRRVPLPALLPPAFLNHRAVFVVVGAGLLALTISGVVINPLDMPLLAGAIILVLGVPHGAFDVAVWTDRNGLGRRPAISTMLFGYVALAGGFFGLWLMAPALALPVFLAMSIYHFSGDWDHDLDRLPRLLVAAAMITAPAGLHRGEVVEIFSWLAPEPVANSVGLIMAAMALPLLQASVVVIALIASQRPWAAAELVVVLALAWLTPPMLFFLVYFCGLHSMRHMIETHQQLHSASVGAFFRSALPYAPLAIIGTLIGAFGMSTLPPGPALIGMIFMALGALTVPHIVVVELCSPGPRARD